jgi:hypothetical protein
MKRLGEILSSDFEERECGVIMCGKGLKARPGDAETFFGVLRITLFWMLFNPRSSAITRKQIKRNATAAITSIDSNFYEMKSIDH